MAKDRRTFMGFWVRPKSQLLLALVLSAGFVVIALILTALLFSFEIFLQDLASSGRISAQSAIAITSFVYFYLRIPIAIATAFAVIGLLVGMLVSHRIYGPMVPIRAHIGHLIRGEYFSRITLRNSDEFRDIAEDLNALAETLEKKS